MARPIRIQYPGAVYHVMARGSHGQEIFQDDQDRQRFLETLGEACEKTGFRIHACVLMGNHYHLLVETPEGNLVAGINGCKGPTPSATTAIKGIGGGVESVAAGLVCRQ
jgi:REP element-mobilizing transposase RayT